MSPDFQMVHQSIWSTFVALTVFPFIFCPVPKSSLEECYFSLFVKPFKFRL